MQNENFHEAAQFYELSRRLRIFPCDLFMIKDRNTEAFDANMVVAYNVRF